MAYRFYKHKDVGYGLIIPHGSFAFFGVILLAWSLWEEKQRLLRLYFGYIVISLLVVTAALGLLLLYMHKHLGKPREAWMMLHIFMALTALFFLAVYLAPTYQGASQ